MERHLEPEHRWLVSLDVTGDRFAPKCPGTGIACPKKTQKGWFITVTGGRNTFRSVTPTVWATRGSSLPSAASAISATCIGWNDHWSVQDGSHQKKGPLARPSRRGIRDPAMGGLVQ